MITQYHSDAEERQVSTGIVKSLAMALDDFGDVPLDRQKFPPCWKIRWSCFLGKYKSLFLANRGSKKQRLDALMGAIVEVYASVYGPDSIRYRAERGLAGFHEEMGNHDTAGGRERMGPYFMPLYSGVAVNNNEFRWSPR